MNAFAATAVCATLAGLGATALLFALASPDRPATVHSHSVQAAPGPSEPRFEPVLVVEAPDVPPIVIVAEVEAPSPPVPPSFALDLTFTSAPLRRGFIDGSPVFSADLAPAVPAGGGALRLHAAAPSPVPAAESPPLSGASDPPPLARLARSTVLQVRPPLRPSFRDATSFEALSPTGAPVDPHAEPPAASAPSPWGGLFSVAARPDALTVRTSRVRPAQTGMASWYGPGFHGRRTASGERFNQNDMTAAHPHLPFGSRVRVVDERTGRSVVVRINDRGPFKPGRIIDLSKGSAQALGMGGLARVQLVSAE